MERICKNCDQLLYAHKTYCSSCGAKWIEKRITMRNVANDFTDLYLGFDTRFMRTFIDLFRKPEAVINGYITGRRMAYIDAVRYLLVALFISGLYVFVLKKANIDLTQLAASMQPEPELLVPTDLTDEAAVKTAQQTAAMNKNIQEFAGSLATDYQAVILFITIPFLAFLGRITFWGKRFYNFTEQCVFYMYTYSHIMILTTPVSIALALLSPKALMTYSFVSFPLMLVYNAYVYKRCFKLDIQQTILRTLVALLVVVIGIIVLMIIGILIGVLVAVIYKKTTGG
ncbi:MAG: DUF3667 domain-containing protein [Nonlabens sp.]|nr:DUF3667 domain-containing protein [Nonlabens sp.]